VASDAVFGLAAVVVVLAGLAVVRFAATGRAARAARTVRVFLAGDAAVVLTDAARALVVLGAKSGDRFAATGVTATAGAAVVATGGLGSALLTLTVDAPLFACCVARAVRIAIAVRILGLTPTQAQHQ
jgi:hypothetical protein